MALTPYEVAVYSGAIAATGQLGEGIVVHSQRSLILNVHISAVNVAGTLDVKLKGRDAWGNLFDIPGATMATINGTGDFVFYMGPALPAIPNESLPVLIPAVIQVIGTVGGGGNFTGQVGLTLID